MTTTMMMIEKIEEFVLRLKTIAFFFFFNECRNHRFNYFSSRWIEARGTGEMLVAVNS
jgi:hypothetical protein